MKPAMSEFAGTERYKVRRRLGAGGFGIVYEADDSLLGGTVALKVLHRQDGSALYRFKNEFRSLAHLKHPNLVALHELATEGGRWFYTMDLISGVDIVTFVRGVDGNRSDQGDAGPSRPEASSRREETFIASQIETRVIERGSERGIIVEDADRPPSARPPLAQPPFDLDRLRDAFAQLAHGVAVLHEAGKVHRDIKPSNVLVDGNGRVVLLDFGVLAELDDDVASADRVIGTPLYMAPEQALGVAIGSACDWYGVGCVLYMALTGRPPIRGRSSADVLARKLFETPPPPRLVAADVPDDLDELCMALLAREARDRPSDTEVLRRLSVGQRSSSSGMSSAAPPISGFVGRVQELDVLSHAYRRVRDGRAFLVTVRGRSGIGKTTLVRRFLEQARRADRRVVALTGSCYERESVPHKALDALVDSLRRHLRRLSEAELSAVLPRNLHALARLFPVFEDVMKPDSQRADEIRDAIELRRRAVAALRELLARIADRSLVVLFIDDLQWGDADSVSVLAEILAPPDPPRVLLVLGYRNEDVTRNDQLKDLDTIAAGPHVDRVDIELGGLAEGEARTLMEQLLDDGAIAMDRAQSEKVLHESGGVPFQLIELVSFLRMARESDASDTQLVPQPGLDGSLVDALVRARASLLAPGARCLLEIICVSGQPLARASALRAASLDSAAVQSSLEALDAARLIRTTFSGDSSRIETFHDRVREAVVGGLAPDVLAERHSRIARALEAEAGCDPERLSAHLCAAGEVERARTYVELAADRATRALAFERAVRLYRLALELSGNSQALRAKHADALANAGHGAAAGRAYLGAVAGARGDEVLDLKRRAAEQLLRSGHVDEALPIVEKVLADVGLRIPATLALSVASLLVQRAKLRIRGFGFHERRDVPADELRKIDVCWALGNGMGGIDIIRGADFQARHLWLALRAGEPYRISRALAWEGVLMAMEGGAGGLERASVIAARSMELAKQIAHPHALAWATASEAIRSFCLGNWSSARIHSEESVSLFREHCADIGWEVGSIEMWFWLPALRWLGDFAPFLRRAAPCAKEGVERGDLYTATGVRTHVLPHAHLMEDQPDDALREGREAIAQLSQDRWLTQHWCNAVTQAHASLYAMRLGRALDGLERDGKRIQHSMQTRMQLMRIQLLDVRARVMVAAAREDKGRRKALLTAAERDAARLEREGLGWANALAAAARGGAAAVRGDLEQARTAYERAARVFTTLDMQVHALAARAKIAQVEGGEARRVERARCLGQIAERGVRNAERYAEMLLP
jgi:serine/threonine protein kinase/tetratricopeptide (TPR) repeat protein